MVATNDSTVGCVLSVLRAPYDSVRFAPRKDAAAQLSMSRSVFYYQIKKGLIPSPVHISRQRPVWSLDELNCVAVARLQGRTDDELRALVVMLVVLRSTGEVREVAHLLASRYTDAELSRLADLLAKRQGGGS